MKVYSNEFMYPPELRILGEQLLENTMAPDKIDGPLFKKIFREAYVLKNNSYGISLRCLQKKETALILSEKNRYFRYLEQLLLEDSERKAFNLLADSLGFFNPPILKGNYYNLEEKKLKVDYEILFNNVLNTAIEYVHFSTFKLNDAFTDTYLVSHLNNSYLDIGFRYGLPIQKKYFVGGLLDSVKINGNYIKEADYEFYFSENEELFLDIKSIEKSKVEVKGRLIYESILSGHHEWPFEMSCDIE